MQNRHLNPTVGCVHGRRITECHHCVTERIEWMEWQRRTDQLIEMLDKLGPDGGLTSSDYEQIREVSHA
jgi:hypothetical protein